MTAELKQAVAGELRADIAMEKAGALDPPALASVDPPAQFDRVYVVSLGSQVETSAGDTCWLSGGDILRFGRARDSASTALLNVASSRLADGPVALRLQ